MSDELNPQQKAFCDSYVTSFSGIRAAIDAGYTGDRDTLYVTASNLLSLSKVKAYLETKWAERVMSPSELLSRFTHTANANMADFIDDTGNVDLSKLHAAGLGVLVRELTQTSQGTKIKLHDSMRAQELLAKYHQLLTDRVDITSNGKAIATEESIDRLSDIIARATDRDDA